MSLSKVLTMDIEKIRRTMEETSPTRALNAAADSIIAAKTHLYPGHPFLGSPGAAFMSFYFNQIFDECAAGAPAPAPARCLNRSSGSGKDDVFIGISFPRYSKRTVKAIDVCQGAWGQRSSPSPTPPVRRWLPSADHLLLARSDMASFVDSLVAPLSLINALIVAVGMQPSEGEWAKPTPSWRGSGTNTMYMKRMRRISSDETGI